MTAAFLTVAVTGLRDKKPSPGDYDPAIAVALLDSLKGYWSRALRGTHEYLYYQTASLGMQRSASGMERGSEVPWWGTVLQASDKMTYVCDSKLGSPTTVDCSQIAWQQLGAGSDIVEVGPGVVKFLSSSEYGEILLFSLMKCALTVVNIHLQCCNFCHCRNCTQLGADQNCPGYTGQCLRVKSNTTIARREGLLRASSTAQRASGEKTG